MTIRIQPSNSGQPEGAARPSAVGEALACGMSRQDLQELAMSLALDLQAFATQLTKEGFKLLGRTTWSHDQATPTTVLISPDSQTIISLVHRPTLSEDPKMGPINAAVQQAGPRTVGEEIKTVFEIALPVPQQLFQHFLDFEAAVKLRGGRVTPEALKIVMDQRYSLNAMRENLGHERVHVADATKPWGKVHFSDLIARIRADGARPNLSSEQLALVGPPPGPLAIAGAHLVMEIRAHVVNRTTKPESATLCREAVLAIDAELNGARRPEQIAALLDPVRSHLIEGGYHWIRQPGASAEAARLILENAGELLSAGLPAEALQPLA